MDPITTLLTDAEEQVIVDLIISAQRRALPVTKDTIMSLVSSLLSDERNLMEINKGGSYIFGRSGTSIPDETWYDLFLKRHQNIANGMNKSLSASSRNVNQQDVKQWFADVRSYLAERDFLDILYEPKRNFNIHESEFEFSPKKSNLLAGKDLKSNNNEFERLGLSVLVNIGANGALPPPLFIYPNLRIPIAVYDSLPSKIAAIGKSESGQINNELLYEYLCNAFDEWLTFNKIQRPVIVWSDRHETQIDYHLVKQLAKLQIIIILIPSNTTHFMQPVAVEMLTPMKKAWVKHINDFNASNPNEYISKENFAQIFLPIYMSIMSRDKIKNSFKKCGIHPYDVEAPDYSRLRLVTEDSRDVAISEKIEPEGLVERGKQITPVQKQCVATQTQFSQFSKSNIYSTGIRGDSMFPFGAQSKIETPSNLTHEIDVEVGLSDPKPEINVYDLSDLKDDDLPDQEDKIIDEDLYDPLPKNDEDDLLLPVAFNKQSFFLKDNSEKGRNTDLGPNANLLQLWNHFLLSTGNEEWAAEKDRFPHKSREPNPRKIIKCPKKFQKSPSVRCEPKQERVPKLNQTHNHVSRKKKNLPIKCDYCDYSCRLKQEIYKHIKLKHAVHQCSSCDFKCNGKHILNLHIKTFHMQPYNCPYCDFKCVVKSKFLIHMKKVHPNPYSCSHCDFATKVKVTLIRHINRHHANIKSFKCKYCDYAYVLKKSLDLHEMFAHKKKNSYKCPACIHVAKTKLGLLRHTESNHKKQEPIEVVKQELTGICLPAWTNQDHMSGLNQEIKIDTEFFGVTEDTELLESSRPNYVDFSHLGYKN